MDGLDTFVNQGVRFIKFNRPHRKNALTAAHYQEIARILNEDAISDETVVTVFTGTGEYFTSGNDIKSIVEKLGANSENTADNAFIAFKNMVNGLINYPKILVAVVNGPAIGIGVTMLGLCDIVYASEKATFLTPFVKLGLCAEACSSYTLSRIMGRSKASEMLLLGKKFTAREAYECGLVSEVLAHDKIDELVVKLLAYGKLPINTVRANKKLLMSDIRDVLCECNNREYEALSRAINSEDMFNGLMSFTTRKSKL